MNLPVRIIIGLLCLEIFLHLLEIVIDLRQAGYFS